MNYCYATAIWVSLEQTIPYRNLDTMNNGKPCQQLVAKNKGEFFILESFIAMARTIPIPLTFTFIRPGLI